MLTYLGNSWWFQLPYYLGLNYNYDTGIKYRFGSERWHFHLAYYFMAERLIQSDREIPVLLVKA